MSQEWFCNPGVLGEWTVLFHGLNRWVDFVDFVWGRCLFGAKAKSSMPFPAIPSFSANQVFRSRIPSVLILVDLVVSNMSMFSTTWDVDPQLTWRSNSFSEVVQGQ